MVKKGATVRKAWGPRTGRYVLQGRKLGTLELAKRKALRRAGVGKSLFREDISPASANRREAWRTWSKSAEETDAITAKRDAFNERWPGSEMVRDLNRGLKSAEAREEVLKGRVGLATLNYNLAHTARKSGVKRKVRLALAGSAARGRLRRNKGLKPLMRG